MVSPRPYFNSTFFSQAWSNPRDAEFGPTFHWHFDMFGESASPPPPLLPINIATHFSVYLNVLLSLQQ
jgi:hypothetical protein